MGSWGSMSHMPNKPRFRHRPLNPDETRRSWSVKLIDYGNERRYTLRLPYSSGRVRYFIDIPVKWPPQVIAAALRSWYRATLKEHRRDYSF